MTFKENLTQILVAMSAIPISGKNWDSIQFLGGLEAVWNQGTEAFSHMLGRNGAKMSMSDALKWAKHVENFEASGGYILGQAGPHELDRLLRAPSQPLCAYLRGNRHTLKHRPAVAIIGTREASQRGLKRAFSWGESLAQAGCLIVSGGANGIDMAAHQGALSGGGETLVVLGNPLHLTQDERPSRILDLQPQENVTTLSMFGPWVKTVKTLFVIRNQYVAALSDALIVIEGKLDSGTLHTAQFARQMNIPVWAVPGDPDNPLAGAANFLLSEGVAKALLKEEQVLESLGLTATEKKIILSDDPVLQALQKSKGRLTFDLLCDVVKKPAAELQINLLELQMMGSIRKEGTEFVLA